MSSVSSPHQATTPTPPIIGTKLDHVAHAVHYWEDVWHRYATDLGAEWNSGGPGPGFAPAQLRFANSARVEVLRPCNTEVNDFLIRFLSSNGPGAHHLTFKVPSLDDAIEGALQAGFEPIGINKSDPEWMECFLHPRSAWGVVVQLAEQAIPWTSDPPEEYPAARRTTLAGEVVGPATFTSVTHVVSDLDGASKLFADLLDATITDEGAKEGFQWRELAWDAPLHLRLIGPEDPSAPPSLLADWLDGRQGRIHHLEFTVPELEELPTTVPVSTTSKIFSVASPEVVAVVPANENAALALACRPG